jgi:hypothetical protein
VGLQGGMGVSFGFVNETIGVKACGGNIGGEVAVGVAGALSYGRLLIHSVLKL